MLAIIYEERLMSNERLEVLKAPIAEWEDACKQQVSFKLRRILFELDLWNTKVARALKDQIPAKKIENRYEQNLKHL